MNTGDARAEIMRSIRAHLARSAHYDGRETRIHTDHPRKSVSQSTSRAVVADFKRNLELVDGHCILVNGPLEIEDAINRITKGKRIATSEASLSTRDLFEYEVGITGVQLGIAETGTLVLDSSIERNRLVSLIPPVHIAVLDASRIYPTLADALSLLQSRGEVSPAITFITGPSRTADIELTLAIGVHGPQELYVIINLDN
ncbi:MAG TPA: lactate utilization protein [Pyrinomonadaceae bacterium]|nr:lactate utilization protein [Pyrinomonadaceae bacterium]